MKQYRNPIILAREWQRALIEGRFASRADLARVLGITRARVTQVLNTLNLPPEVASAIADLGDPLSPTIVSEWMLRPLLKLSVEDQLRAWRDRTVFPARRKE